MDDRWAERPVGVAQAATDHAAPRPVPSRWVQQALASDGTAGDLELLVAATPALLDLAGVCIQLRAGQVRRNVTGAGARLAADLEECGPARQRPSELAARSGEPVQVSLPDPARPELSEAGLRAGIRSVWALPLAADGAVFGAMTTYATEPEPWASARAGGARRMAQQAERIVELAAERARLQHLNKNLWQAIESRTTIGQAQGVLMATQGLTVEDAFRALARASQDGHRKLRDVAADIVADLSARLAGNDGAASNQQIRTGGSSGGGGTTGAG